MDTTVIVNYGGKLLANRNIIPTTSTEKGEIRVVFTPNGNINWQTSQKTTVNIEKNDVIEIDTSNVKYKWSRSYTEPAIGAFTDVLIEGAEISKSGDTGNDWYLWVYIPYKENGMQKTYISRSNPFYLDNTLPTGVLDVEEVIME